MRMWTALVFVLSFLLPRVAWSQEPSPLDRPLPGVERGSELTSALAAASPGGTITLVEGTYTGAFVVSNLDNLTIKAAEGDHVVLTRRDTRFVVPNSLWTLDVTVGPAVYRRSEILGNFAYFSDGRRILPAKDLEHFDVLMADNIPTIFRDGSTTIIYLDGLNPNSTSLFIASSDMPALECSGSENLRVEGIEIRFSGAQSIDIEDNCDGMVIDGITVYGGGGGIRVHNNLSDDITVENSWFVDYYGDDEGWYYRDCKGNAACDSTAIALTSRRPIIRYNTVRFFFNGVSTGCVDPCFSDDMIIEGNRIIDVPDDCIEIDLVTVRGIIRGNSALRCFVAFSASPRQYGSPPENTLVTGNLFGATRYELFDRIDPGVLDKPQGTKFNSHPIVEGQPTAAGYLVFERNSWYCGNECYRGAPTGQSKYPDHISVTSNIFYSEQGPTVRDPGGHEDENLFERNIHYVSQGTTMISNWSKPFDNTRQTYISLDTARKSVEGLASRWEKKGYVVDPQYSIPGEPSSLQSGSPAEGRGAFSGGGSFSITSTVTLPTGWILVKGEGFDSLGTGLGLLNPKVVSKNTAFAREFAP